MQIKAGLVEMEARLVEMEARLVVMKMEQQLHFKMNKQNKRTANDKELLRAPPAAAVV